jgi:L-malate glycosyltransferase
MLVSFKALVFVIFPALQDVLYGPFPMNPVRILHLHSAFDLGGKEARAVQLMNHFGDEARHVILSAMPEAMGARSAIDPAIAVEFPGEAAPPLYGKPAPGRYLRLARYMQGFDLVLSYNWGSMDGVMAHCLLGPFMKLPPLIHHEDGFNQDEAVRLNAKRSAFRRLALKGAQGLVVPSATLEQIALSVWKRPKASVHRIVNGINIPLYGVPPAADAFPGLVKREGEVVVGTIAGLRAVKNLPRLVRAVAAAGPHVRLAIAGEGPERAAIIAETERLGMADRLIMPGFMRDPASYVGLFDIFALSSDSEQYPISLVEAMAAGLPAVCTDVGDVRSIVTDANRPYIIAKDDEAGFAKALADLAQDSALRKRIGLANQQLAVAHYGEEKMFAHYRQLYGNAMKRADFARQS